MANQERLNRLNLFEAVVIGIYGNWLISFIDKISFLNYPIIYGFSFWGYQVWAVALSLATLLILFALSIFRPELVTRRFGFLLGVGHIVGNLGALWAEGLPQNIDLNVFFAIGAILFLIIYTIELQRVQIGVRNRG